MPYQHSPGCRESGPVGSLWLLPVVRVLRGEGTWDWDSVPVTEKPHSQGDWYRLRHVTEQPCPLFPGIRGPIRSMGAQEPLSSSLRLVLAGVGGMSPSHPSPGTPVAVVENAEVPEAEGEPRVMTKAWGQGVCGCEWGHCLAVLALLATGK